MRGPRFPVERTLKFPPLAPPFLIRLFAGVELALLFIKLETLVVVGSSRNIPPSAAFPGGDGGSLFLLGLPPFFSLRTCAVSIGRRNVAPQLQELRLP